MRIDVKKFLFIGAKKDQAHFFQEAQKLGIIEFIDPSKKKAPPLSEEAHKYTTAIKILRGYALENQKIRRDRVLALKICDEIIALKKEKTEAEEILHATEQEIKRIVPFGNFSVETLQALETESNRKVCFYIGKTSKHLLDADPELILINSLDGIDYFIAISEEALTHRDLIQEEIPYSLATLLDGVKKQKAHIAEKDTALKGLTCYSWLMHFALVEELNQVGYDFANASVSTELDDTLFIVEGWVPRNKQDKLTTLARELNIYKEEVAVDTSDTRPTYLENKGLPRVGEDLVHIFDVPSSQDKDPSIWLLSCFALFFAMIVGDAGYGLVFLLTGLLMRYKIKNLKGFMQRFVTLITILGTACIVWGLMMGSIFGIKLSEENPLRRYAPITWLLEKKADYHVSHKDDVYEFWIKQVPELAKAKTGQEFMSISNSLNLPESPETRFMMNIGMELALLVGCVHVILGLLRYIRKNPTGAGWIAFIIGGYLYLPHYLDATSIFNFTCGLDKEKAAEVGIYLLGGGVIYSVFLGIALNGILGVFEIMTSVQIFADILSYLRIFALGLAGSVVSSTTNELAAGLPLVIGVIALIGAHLVNILLSVMGGVIHGLRLNFLEWYHYSFEGGGKQFKPLELHTFE